MATAQIGAPQIYREYTIPLLVACPLDGQWPLHDPSSINKYFDGTKFRFDAFHGVIDGTGIGDVGSAITYICNALIEWSSVEHYNAGPTFMEGHRSCQTDAACSPSDNCYSIGQIEIEHKHAPIELADCRRNT